MLLTYQRQTKHSQTGKYQYYTTPFYLDCATKVMSDSTSKSETTQLENTTYNILAALGRDADFLYDTIGTYIRDAQNANRSDLVDMWNTIKQDRQDICRC